MDEEVRRCCNEMKSGIAEAQAYENFGRRCQISEYIKIGTILAQNLRKGSDGLADLLEGEALRGMEEKAEAGTEVRGTGRYQAVVSDDADAWSCSCYTDGTGIPDFFSRLRKRERR